MKYIIAALIISVFFSCETNVCNQKITWPVQAGFYIKPDTLVTVDSLSVSVWLLYNDSIIFENKSLKQFEFSLPARADSGTFVFKVKSQADTLTIFHTNTLYFISKQCGYGYKQEIDTIIHTKHVFSKITWSVPQVDKNDKENIQIYY